MADREQASLNVSGNELIKEGIKIKVFLQRHRKKFLYSGVSGFIDQSLTNDDYDDIDDYTVNMPSITEILTSTNQLEPKSRTTAIESTRILLINNLYQG